MNDDIAKQLSLGGWWINHFADLRTSFNAQQAGERERQLLNETKILSIFWGGNFIVEDGDVLNNTLLQKLFLDNAQHSRLLLDSGIFRVALRQDVSGLVELNEKTKVKRAFADNYTKVKGFCRLFDQYVADHRIDLISWSVNETTNHFRSSIREFAFSIDTPLAPSDHEILSNILQTSEQEFGNLLAGNLVKIAREKHNLVDDSLVIQAIRAARLARLKDGSSTIILPPDDIEQSFIDFAVKPNRAHLADEQANREMIDVMPKLIPNLRTIQRLNFKRIEEIISIGHQMGYYKHLHSLKAHAKTDTFQQDYIAFLTLLNEFLQEISVGFELEYIGWQKDIVSEYIKQRSDNAYRNLEMLVTTIPLVAAGTLLIAGNFFTIAPPISGITGTVAAAVGVGKLVIERKRKQNKSEIENILKSHKTI